MTSPMADELMHLCVELQNGRLAEPVELERALLVLCAEAMSQQDRLEALTAALSENAKRARGLELQIKNEREARAA